MGIKKHIWFKFYLTHLVVNVWDETKNHNGVCLFFWSEERGSFYVTHLDLYNVEMSFQKGTFKEDLMKVFKKTIILDNEYEEYSITYPLEPLENDKCFNLS